jgi:exodeoxyribonuclease VII large subunit
LATRERRVQHLQRQLDTFDLGRRLADIRTRLVGSDGTLRGAITKRQHRARLGLQEAAGRLDTLSPLKVLGRGYAVCWTGDRAHVIRAATEVAAGDTVRVTLSEGEIEAKVSRTE